MCDQWAKVEQCRLKYYRRNQETPPDTQLPPSPESAAGGRKGGRRRQAHYLPGHFHRGGAMQMGELYQDAVAVVRTYGKPRIFITFARNTSWPEIRNP